MSKEITQTEYYKEIDRIAREALENEREYGQDADDAAWKNIAGHQWIICTACATQIPHLTSSDGADFLEGHDLIATYRVSGLGGLHSLIAFACMMEDVQEKIDALHEAAEDAAEE